MKKERNFKHILVIVLCLCLSIATMLTLVSCDGGEAPGEPTAAGTTNENKDPSPGFKQIQKGDTVYILPTDSSAKLSVTVKNKNLQPQDLILATSIQGLLARQKAQVYIGKENDEWITYLKENYGVEFKVLESMEALFNLFKEAFPENRTYVTFDYNESAVASSRLNQATTVASATGSILAPSDEKLIEFVKAQGFTLAEGGDFVTEATGEADLLKKYQDKLSQDVIGVLSPQMKATYALRDYLFATNAGVLLADDAGVTQEAYQNLNPLAMAFGAGSYESTAYGGSITKGFNMTAWSELTGKAGIFPVYASKMANLSLYASLSKDVGTQKATKPLETADGVHYVAVLLNTGYDIGYWEDASTSKQKLAVSDRGAYPIGYTMTPALLELMPNAMKQAYETMSDNELFVAAPSGLGMADLKALKGHKNGATLNTYLERTNETLGKADLGYLSLYGQIADTEQLDALAGLSNVKGGFVLTSNHVTPKGGAYLKNDKLFIAAREVLRGDNFRTNDQIANDSTEKLAARLSRYSTDKTSIDAYTLLQIEDSAEHKNYAKLLDKLYKEADATKIKFVTPNQLLDLIKANVSAEAVAQEQTNYSLNIAPTGRDVQLTTQSGVKIQFDLSEYIDDENPEDKDKLTVSLASRAQNGKAVQQRDRKNQLTTKFTYTPNADFVGEEVFEYNVSDGNEIVKAKIVIKVE